MIVNIQSSKSPNIIFTILFENVLKILQFDMHSYVYSQFNSRIHFLILLHQFFLYKKIYVTGSEFLWIFLIRAKGCPCFYKIVWFKYFKWLSFIWSYNISVLIKVLRFTRYLKKVCQCLKVLNSRRNLLFPLGYYNDGKFKERLGNRATSGLC